MKIETTLRQAAQQALEAYDKHEPLAVVMEELRIALEQQQAEPVAWMDKDGDVYPMPENKNWAPPHTMLYTHPPQRKPLTEEQDVNRYRWLRDRLQVRYIQAVSGEKRRGLVLRVGHGFLDSKTPPERGWTDPRYFDECRQEVDAAIDAAIEQAHGIKGEA